MKPIIDNFITITTNKSGIERISQTPTNEAAVCEYLRDVGFGYTRINNKKHYYKRADGKLASSSVQAMKDHLLEIFENKERYITHQEIDHNSIANWYLAKNRLKVNDIFNHYLCEELGEGGKHALLLESDIDYKHNYYVQLFLDNLKEQGFKHIMDNGTVFRSGAPLYFKHQTQNEYFIFAQYNSDKKFDTGFDLYTVIYNKPEDFGMKKPGASKVLVKTFDLESEFALPQPYFTQI